MRDTVLRRAALGLLTGLFLAAAAAAQEGAQVGFGSAAADPDQPIDIVSDTLNVNQNDGTALFEGNVIVNQGEMRLSAPKVLVIYVKGEDGKTRIQRVEASGGVTLVNGPDTAEGQDAVYTLDDSHVVMTGDVLLTQGPNVMSGQKLNVNLKDGTGQMEGRVRTILKTEGEAPGGTAGKGGGN